MAKTRATKDKLIDATIRLVARGGQDAARMRSIAREAGVTEAAIYRHYPSKDALCLAAYSTVVDQLIDQKRHLAESDKPFRTILREWIALTFSFFDEHPDAFTFVLLTTQFPPQDAPHFSAHQSTLFVDILERAIERGEAARIDPTLALCHFTGLMLNVPRLIREGTLEGPAASFVDAVADAAWRILAPDDRA